MQIGGVENDQTAFGEKLHNGFACHAVGVFIADDYRLFKAFLGDQARQPPDGAGFNEDILHNNFMHMPAGAGFGKFRHIDFHVFTHSFS